MRRRRQKHENELIRHLQFKLEQANVDMVYWRERAKAAEAEISALGSVGGGGASPPAAPAP